MVVFSAGIVAILRLTFASGDSESPDSGKNPTLDASTTQSIVPLLTRTCLLMNSKFNGKPQASVSSFVYTCGSPLNELVYATQPNKRATSPPSQFKPRKE